MITSEEINAFITSKFGANSKVHQKLDSDTLLIKTGNGALYRIKESDVHHHNLGAHERQKQQHRDDIHQQAKENVAKERETAILTKQAKRDAISADSQAKRELNKFDTSFSGREIA